MCLKALMSKSAIIKPETTRSDLLDTLFLPEWFRKFYVLQMTFLSQLRA
jgi:hypothetical protein